MAAYGVKISSDVLVDETFPQEPISTYGKGKVACEEVLMRADAERKFRTTIFRPSNTYGPGQPLIDQLELDPVAWDRVERGLPILCADSGMSLWQSTHRDNCGKAFAYGALNPRPTARLTTPRTTASSPGATTTARLAWRSISRSSF